MRVKSTNEDQQLRIKNAFNALYKASMRKHIEVDPNYPDQLDESGNPYLLASDLRMILTSVGEKDDCECAVCCVLCVTCALCAVCCVLCVTCALCAVCAVCVLCAVCCV